MRMRVQNGARGTRSSRGFSLVELLVVIVILGVLFVVGGREIASAWKRQKLQSAATDLKVLMQRALPEMQRRNMQTFIQIGPYVSSGGVGYLPVYLLGDANANGTVDAFANPPTVLNPDLLIDEYDLMVTGQTGVKGVTGQTQDFSMSVLDIAQIQSAGWSNNTTNRANVRAIMCDFQGRAIAMVPGPPISSTGRQVAAPVSVVLTHVGVVDGTLGPATRYVLTVNPVWSVRVRKQIRDGAGVWVDQQGG